MFFVELGGLFAKLDDGVFGELTKVEIEHPVGLIVVDLEGFHQRRSGDSAGL